MNVEQQLTEATGFARLGMLDEAEDLLQQIPPTDQSGYLAAQNALLGIYLSRHESQKVADQGRTLILQGIFDTGIIERTMMALTFAGRHEEGEEVLRLVEHLGRPLAYHAYQMACFASLRGDFSNALRWLETELQNPRHFWARSIGDSDLCPLWRWLANGQLSLEDAHRLLGMNLESACVAASAPDADIFLDQNDLKGAPVAAQDLFRFNFTVGIFELNPRAAARNPQAAMEFRKTRALHISRIAAMIRAGARKALDVVLAAQPGYAGEQAAWRNHLGARYHIVWALARKPDMLGAFYAEPGLDFMFSFLDSLANVERSEPGFCARMDALAKLIFTDLDEAWKMLEQAPPSTRAHPLFQLRQAMAYGADGDYERALPIYLELCDIWPDDAAAFANACRCFIKLGRWVEAETVLEQAPRCYQTFHLYHCQLEDLKHRNVVSSPHTTLPFRGQPDLGGLLEAPQPSSLPPSDLLTDGEMPPLKSQPLAVSP